MEYHNVVVAVIEESMIAAVAVFGDIELAMRCWQMSMMMAVEHMVIVADVVDCLMDFDPVLDVTDR